MNYLKLWDKELLDCLEGCHQHSCEISHIILKRNWTQNTEFHFPINLNHFIFLAGLWQSLLYLAFTNSWKVEYGSKLKCISTYSHSTALSLHYIWPCGLAEGAEACAYLCLTCFQSFWNWEHPSEASFLHDGNVSAYTCSTQPHFHEIKPNLLRLGETRAFFLFIKSDLGSWWECLGLIFHVVYSGRLGSENVQRKSEQPRRKAHFCPAELYCEILLLSTVPLIV